jgi:hypothetical protein
MHWEHLRRVDEPLTGYCLVTGAVIEPGDITVIVGGWVYQAKAGALTNELIDEIAQAIEQEKEVTDGNA